MSNGIFDSTTIPILQEVVNFSAARHDVLVGNVANLDTPGYQVRDLSVETFQERLEDAIAARREQKQPISPGQISGDRQDPMRQVRDALKSILYHDGSDVDIEQQVLQISKNQYMHNVAISIMSNQFRMLQSAISERV